MYIDGLNYFYTMTEIVFEKFFKAIVYLCNKLSIINYLIFS